jgi:3-oxoacyl-[acyl-carrier protein] reductase
MAKEWGRYKVNVNAVAFGPIRTRLTEGSAKGDSTIKVEDKEIKVGVNPELLVQMERMIPLGRVGTPQEAAGAVYLFCSPESNFISGQHVICGGGFTI